MRALPGCAAVKNAPDQPILSASLPFASGGRTRESEWMGAHLRASVPLRNTATWSPTWTHSTAPLPALPMVNVAADEAAGVAETVHLAAVPGGTAVPRGAAVPWAAAGAAAPCHPPATITPPPPMHPAAARIDAPAITHPHAPGPTPPPARAASTPR